MNDADTIREAFADYYRTAILSEESDPNKLHDLKAALDGYQVYGPAQAETLVERYLGGAERDSIDPILDACVALYKEQLNDDAQVDPILGSRLTITQAGLSPARTRGLARPHWPLISFTMPSLGERILEETKTLPEPQAGEVLGIICYLKHKGTAGPDALSASDGSDDDCSATIWPVPGLATLIGWRALTAQSVADTDRPHWGRERS
jgi:hypothetical protein